MAYREDEDLQFLQYISSEDLNTLVFLLTHEHNDRLRINRNLSRLEQFKKHYPDHKKYWDLIAAQIQGIGATTLARAIRMERGVKYKKILQDVCEVLKVPFKKESEVEVNEKNLLFKLLTDAIKKMSPNEIKELSETIGMTDKVNSTREAILDMLQETLQNRGLKSNTLITNLVTVAVINRTMPFFAKTGGPIIVASPPTRLLLACMLAVQDITRPAYRMIIPVVTEVAILRQNYLYGDENKPDGLNLSVQ